MSIFTGNDNNKYRLQMRMANCMCSRCFSYDIFSYIDDKLWNPPHAVFQAVIFMLSHEMRSKAIYAERVFW